MNLTITQTIEAFPDECRELIPKVNRSLNSRLKPYHAHVKSIRFRHYDLFTEQFLIQVIGIYYHPEVIEKQIKRNNMLLEALDGPKEDKITDLMIERAKEVPLATLYDFQKIKTGHVKFTACCPFHNDSHPSFVVYPNNTFYCFSHCNIGGDVITFIMKLNGLSFPQAVRYLNDRR